MSQAFSWHMLYWLPFSETFSVYFEKLFERTKDYTKEVVEHIILVTVAYCLLCILLYVGVVKWQVITFRKDVKSPQRVLIVIAHPDDECMFFGPTILNFTRNSDCKVYLLCLSTGNNYGMGKIRKNELYRSCKVLGIEDSCIIINSHTLMPDSMKEKWPVELVARLILHQVEAYNIDTLITFDKQGVSGHLNHCSIYYAVAYLCMDKQLPQDCKVYVLETINVLRKYWLFLDIPLCFLLSRHRYILNYDDKTIIRKAMKQHKSQLLWFRYLYILFSRYTIINTLEGMDTVDIELDLELED